MSVVWEDPPGPGPNAVLPWRARLLPLMEHPNRWARVKDSRTRQQAYSTAAELKSGRNRLPPGRWEFTSRSTADGKGAVYARYLGPDEAR